MSAEKKDRAGCRGEPQQAAQHHTAARSLSSRWVGWGREGRNGEREKISGLSQGSLITKK